MFSAVLTIIVRSGRCSDRRSGEVQSDSLNVRVSVGNVNVQSMSRTNNGYMKVLNMCNRVMKLHSICTSVYKWCVVTWVPRERLLPVNKHGYRDTARVQHNKPFRKKNQLHLNNDLFNTLIYCG